MIRDWVEFLYSWLVDLVGAIDLRMNRLGGGDDEGPEARSGGGGEGGVIFLSVVRGVAHFS